MTLTVHMLHAIMGAGIYAPGSWPPLLPSSTAGNKAPLPFPTRASYTHVATVPHLCQITAAGALVAMAAQPDRYGLPDVAETLYRGPFRGLLLDAGLLPNLLELSQLPWSTEGEPAARSIAAAGLLTLTSTGSELPRPHLKALVSQISRCIDSGASLQTSWVNQMHDLYVHVRRVLKACL